MIPAMLSLCATWNAENIWAYAVEDFHGEPDLLIQLHGSNSADTRCWSKTPERAPWPGPHPRLVAILDQRHEVPRADTG